MFKLEMKTKNAAFDTERNEEVARILRKAAESVTNGNCEGVLVDLFGNKVGSWTLTNR